MTPNGLIGKWERCRLANASRHRSDIVDDLTSDEPIAGDHRVEQPNLHRIDVAGSSQFVHLALVREAGLHNAETSHCAARKVVGSDRISVDHRVRTSIRALRVCDGVDQHS